MSPMVRFMLVLLPDSRRPMSHERPGEYLTSSPSVIPRGLTVCSAFRQSLRDPFSGSRDPAPFGAG
jgi:hypothetical protein